MVKKELIVCLNGEYVPRSKAVVSVFDRGYLYGDAVFETMRCYLGRVFKLTEHVERIASSARTLMIDLPYSQRDLAKKVVNTIEVNSLADAVVRLSISRGVGKRGLRPVDCHPTLVITAEELPQYPEKWYDKGVRIATTPMQRIPPAALPLQIKCANFLAGIIAKMEVMREEMFEMVFLNSNGYVTEGTVSNIFIVKNDMLITPPSHLNVLSGITRETVLLLYGSLPLNYCESIITRHDLFNADECFLTNSLIEIVPVVEVDGRIIGNGKPGTRTRELLNLYRGLC